MAAPYFQGRHTGKDVPLAGFVLVSAILLLPTFFPGKIGWLTSLVPLPVFYYLVSLGRDKGIIFLRNCILLAAGVALLFGSLPMLIFPLTLVPPGIAFSFAVFRGKSPISAGLAGFLILALTWIVYWFGLALLFKTNLYTTLLAGFDNGLNSGLALYEESAEFSPETLESIRRAVEYLRIYVPKILPALLISALLSIVWLNLVLGNLLLKKKDAELTSWPVYSEWKLPESLVWLVVVSGIFFLLLPQPLSLPGLNGLIVCSTVYFFQGLAIVVSLLNRWSVPRLFRVPIYALIFIQTYGIIILSFLGLADVWADFRKLNRAANNNDISA